MPQAGPRIASILTRALVSDCKIPQIYLKCKTSRGLGRVQVSESTAYQLLCLFEWEGVPECQDSRYILPEEALKWDGESVESCIAAVLASLFVDSAKWACPKVERLLGDIEHNEHHHT